MAIPRADATPVPGAALAVTVRAAEEKILRSMILECCERRKCGLQSSKYLAGADGGQRLRGDKLFDGVGDVVLVAGSPEKNNACRPCHNSVQYAGIVKIC